MARRPHIEVYQDASEDEPGWRYRFWAANGQNTENPGQSYTRKSSAVRAAARQHPGIEIRDGEDKVLRQAV